MYSGVAYMNEVYGDVCPVGSGEKGELWLAQDPATAHQWPYLILISTYTLAGSGSGQIV